MIDRNLFANPVALQRDIHSDVRWGSEMPDFAATAKCHALFLTAVEMPEAGLDYPIVFSYAGKGTDGKDEVAPMAVLGLEAGENLYLDGEQWSASYVPAMLRAYPLGIARENDEQYVLCIDPGSPRLSKATGKPLFDAQGQPSALLEDMRAYLEKLEIEVERTRLIGRKLLELGLLQSMRFDATLPDGGKVVVDNFLSVDEKKLAAISDDVAGELTRSGLMKAIQAQVISMAHMSRLVERRWQRRHLA